MPGTAFLSRPGRRARACARCRPRCRRCRSRRPGRARPTARVEPPPGSASNMWYSRRLHDRNSAVQQRPPELPRARRRRAATRCRRSSPPSASFPIADSAASITRTRRGPAGPALRVVDAATVIRRATGRCRRLSPCRRTPPARLRAPRCRVAGSRSHGPAGAAVRVDVRVLVLVAGVGRLARALVRGDHELDVRAAGGRRRSSGASYQASPAAGSRTGTRRPSSRPSSSSPRRSSRRRSGSPSLPRRTRTLEGAERREAVVAGHEQRRHAKLLDGPRPSSCRGRRRPSGPRPGRRSGRRSCASVSSIRFPRFVFVPSASPVIVAPCDVEE